MNTRGLRTGWTTGTCASAAAKAAAIGLVTGTPPATVEVALPAGRRVSFPVEAESSARCVVVKDAGDDPDCTDGARMTATVAFGHAAGVAFGHAAGVAFGHAAGVAFGHAAGIAELRAGPGVGTVTKPGLGLAVGAPAINPVPRGMILAALAEVTDHPLTVTFSVPGGEDMAAKTSNDRLGIVGGISILGTTGIVRPFSTAAYRASVVQQIDVAGAQGEAVVVLATGSRSERAAMRLHPDLPPVCFVEVGDYTGVALRRAAAAGIPRAVVVAMAGKITKLAGGVMMTHFRRSKVDGDLLAAVARSGGAPEAVVRSATETATARHFFETCMAHSSVEPLVGLCRQARAACTAHTGGAVDADIVMVDFDGEMVVARA